MFYNFTDKILNAIFPEKCFICGENGQFCCVACFSKIPQSKIQKYEVYALYEYKNIYINKLLKQLKYKNTRSVAELFAAEISTFILENYSENKKIYLIPIPLSSGDERINNHALEIINKMLMLSKSFGNNFELLDILYKNNKIKQAHIKNRNARIDNIINKIFIINNLNKKEYDILNNLQNTNESIFIIIDDIFTTGATIAAARKALQERFGVQNIFAITVAH